MLSINLAICWKLRESRATRRLAGSENATGADNQQGRPARSAWEPSETARQTRPLGLEDTVRAAWRHAEPGRNDLASEHRFGVTTLSVPIHHGRWRLERSRL